MSTVTVASCVRRVLSRAPHPNSGWSHITRRAKSEVASTSGTNLPKPRLNYRDIADNAVFKSHNAFNRKASLPIGAIQAIDKLYSHQKQLTLTLNSKRNERSLLGDRIREVAKDAEARNTALKAAKALKDQITDLEAKLEEIDDELFRLAIAVPNDTHPEVPIGPESVATVLSHHGPEPIPASPSRDHVDIARALNLVDFQAGATVTGTSWYYLINEGALLEIALVNYALSIASKYGFTPVTVPDVIRADIAHRCGFHPRDQEADQMYRIANIGSSDAPELVLAGTAEIPLAGMFANKIYNDHDLPRRVVGLGRAFRAEAGARGADTRGLYRVHQFTKLELFAVTAEEKSDEIMEEFRKIQVEIFEGLGFPFRVLDMPTEELGASAYRKYDMEAWMPGRGSWGEISSTSNCTDYQSRRMHIRYRKQVDDPKQPTQIPFAHTLNGTAAAVPRLIVALLENGVRFDEGNVAGLDLPKILRPFWVGGSGRDIIRWV
ncbi:unnamed protein product [Somion occarium]|uniref:serine--tRNA ligase n=1 Tax=Somion occarium TaxID=3059160 RepID=A0ABP1CER4_9APHY